MNKPHYLTPPRLGQRLIIWGFYPSEAIVLIALSIVAVMLVFQSAFAHTWLILFPLGYALLKVKIGEDRDNLERLLKIRLRYHREAQTFTLLECFEKRR